MAASRALFRQLVHTNKMMSAVPSCINVITARKLTITSAVHEEQVTHTGQKFDEGDWKAVRFVDGKKVVSNNIAIDMVAEEEIIEVEKRIVYCDGGNGALGHPKVFINLDKPGVHPCGYCGLRYTKKAHH